MLGQWRDIYIYMYYIKREAFLEFTISSGEPKHKGEHGAI